jgi:hypothetical protein
LQESIKLPEHATTEMASIIMVLEEARTKDSTERLRWQKRREQEKAQWDALPEEIRNLRTLSGTAYNPDVNPPAGKFLRSARGRLRYKLFRIREGKWEVDTELRALKAWFDLQLPARDGWTWKSFTFAWDVSVNDPLRAISPFEWDGSLLTEDFGGKKLTQCDPAAFTRQDI